MDFSYWLRVEDNIILIASNEKQLDELMHQAVQPEYPIGVVSGERYPLLADLNVIENIVLRNMFHENISMKQATDVIFPFIESLGLAQKMGARPEDLTGEELINAYILRCISSRKEIILFESPEPYDIYVSWSWLKQMKLDMRLWICCLIDRAPVYDRLSFKKIDFFD